jgi:hypothetical protein
MAIRNQFPKILYISEIPVELSYAGSTLVFRLLEQYPPEKLFIIETSRSVSKRRLSNVTYITYRSPYLRILNKFKLYKLSTFLNVFFKQTLSYRLKKVVRKFEPDVILTVTFNLSWITAYKISSKFKLPFFLLLHDDLLTTENYGIWQNYIINTFRKAYLAADACFCIGPQMEQHYYNLYKKRGSVLYPLRGKNDILYSIDWKNVPENRRLNFCYAGSSGTEDFLPLLNILAEILEKLNHTLTIFSNVTKSELKSLKFLLLPHVTFQPIVHPEFLKAFMHKNVDVNIVLNSFIHEELFKLNFSSKIIEYTSVKLPVLFWGPASSGILNWALGQKYQCIVTSKESSKLEQQIKALEIRNYRKDLAQQLEEIAENTFGYKRNYNLFIVKLSKVLNKE